MDLRTRVAGSPHLQDDLADGKRLQTDRQDIKNRYIQVYLELTVNLAGTYAAYPLHRVIRFPFSFVDF